MKYAKEVKLGSKIGHRINAARAHTSPSLLKDGMYPIIALGSEQKVH